MARKKTTSEPPAQPRETAEKKKKDKPSSLRASLDLIGVLAAAVIIAFVIKGLVFDVYLIPSGSMETALHGRPDGGDRILCPKLNYYFRDLKRWEIAVFKFPYLSAKATAPDEVFEEHKNQNFVKRVVGLPGETLAIAKGDIWIRPENGSGFKREVKPDKVQRGMWLNVYQDDFAILRDDELGVFWKFSGDGQARIVDKKLHLVPSAGSFAMSYRPRVPFGAKRDRLSEMPGIPDRYTLEQPVQFQCRNLLPDGKVCGHVFVNTFKTQNMLARCPACGSLQNEFSAIYYLRRSGLATVGPYKVDPPYARQGENSYRDVDYHIVPDLRVVADMTLSDETASFSVTLSEDSRSVEAVFAGDGRIELLLNHELSKAEHRAVADLAPGVKHRVEFYIVDGAARVFVDSTETALLDVMVWENDRLPSPRSLPRASGVTVAAAGGEVVLDTLLIDRDVFYYNGQEKPNGRPFRGLGQQGEVVIDRENFFPMGDHCTSSFDARSWGPVPLNHVLGPALAIWWPPERISLIPSP